MNMPWFRLYAEILNDPKIQMMPEVYQRRYIMLLCMRCGNGDVTLHETEVAFQLRISDTEWADTKAELIRRGLIDNDNKPTAWERRQYASDYSKSRVSNWRKRKQQLELVTCNDDVTLQKRQSNVVDTDTDTDTDTDKTKTKGRAAPFVLPEQIKPEAWKDWHDYRNTKKGWTAKAKQLSLNTLLALVAKGHDPQKIINTSIERGWTGLFEPKANPKQNVVRPIETRQKPKTPEQLRAEQREANAAFERYQREVGMTV